MNTLEFIKQIILRFKVRENLELLSNGYIVKGKDIKDFAKEILKINDYDEQHKYMNETLSFKPLIINSGWRKDNTTVILSIEYNRYRQELKISTLPTWDFILDSVKLLHESLNDEVNDLICDLNQRQSVTLINNILSDPKNEWIKNFKLSSTIHDDGGRDFTANLVIGENKVINFKGYGKSFECIGQLKHLKAAMGPGDMREFIGSMRNSKTKYGVVLSTRGFTQKAMDSVKESGYNIFCYDSHFLTDIIIRTSIGLKKVKLKYGKRIDHDWWNEIHLSS